MFELPPLPYAKEALEPHMSAQTLGFHHGKHHKGYVDKLNELIAGNPMSEMSLEDIILHTHAAEGENRHKIFNNAAQHWNHSFFWNSLDPNGGGEPAGDVRTLIDTSFGSFEAFKEEFAKQAAGHFGSGWAWLVAEGNSLEIMTTHDADLPFTHGKDAVLTCDLWEHAYYLDYQNARPKFIDAFLEHLANWDFVGQNIAAIRGGSEFGTAANDSGTERPVAGSLV